MQNEDFNPAVGKQGPPDWADELLTAAQGQPAYYNGDEEFARVRFGTETIYDSSLADTGPCFRCFTSKGMFHVLKCEYEQCPKCGLQISTCGCYLTTEKFVELHDPREDDPVWGPLIKQAEEEADRELINHKQRGGRGYCFVYWEKMRWILWKRYGIEWKSPAEMNPGTFYD